MSSQGQKVMWGGIGQALCAPVVWPMPSVSGQNGECRVVVRFLGGLGNLLAVDDDAVLVEHDDGPRQQPGQRSGGEGDSVVIAKAGVEGGAGYDVLDALVGAVAGGCEG